MCRTPGGHRRDRVHLLAQRKDPVTHTGLMELRLRQLVAAPNSLGRVGPEHTDAAPVAQPQSVQRLGDVP